MILAVLLGGCPRPAIETPRPPPATVWVDAFAAGPGEGTAASPFRQVPTTLAPGTELRLASGLYRGPFALTGVRVVGVGQAVLYLEGEGTVVEGTDLSLEGVSVQGGTTGLRLEGRGTVTGVHFSGHRRVAVEAGPGAELAVDGGVFEGVVSDTVAIHLAGATVRVANGVFRAGFRRAIDAAGGVVEVAGGTFEGPREAVHAVDATTTVRGVSVAGGQGPAFFAVRGALTLERVVVTGHEYALQTGVGTTVSVRGLTARRPLVAGVAMVESTGALTDVDVEGSGASGALQLLGSDVVVDGVRLARAQSLGVFVRKGTVKLRRVEVNGVLGEDGSQGDGLHLRDATVEVEDATVRDAAGSAVLASAAARVTIGRLVSVRSGYGALVVERGASVAAREIVSAGSRGPAVSLPDAATLTLDRLEVTGGDVPLWVECAQGARAVVRQIVSAVAQPPSRCIERR